MEINNWNVKFVENIDRFGRDMFIYRLQGDRIEIIEFPKDIKMRLIQPGEVANGLYLDSDMFQGLVDSVHKDFKPSEGKFTEGKLEATETHLQDLRKMLKLK